MPFRHFPQLRRRFVPFLALTLVASQLILGCASSAADIVAAQQSVDAFHAQLDAGQFAAIYAASDAKFKEASTEQQFTDILSAVHRKLGDVENAQLMGSRVGWYTGSGTTVTLTYQTKFTTGSGSETFTWRIDKSGAALYGYHINSNDLITR
jgi:opacity protein-like surface antigen